MNGVESQPRDLIFPARWSARSKDANSPKHVSHQSPQSGENSTGRPRHRLDTNLHRTCPDMATPDPARSLRSFRQPRPSLRSITGAQRGEGGLRAVHHQRGQSDGRRQRCLHIRPPSISPYHPSLFPTHTPTSPSRPRALATITPARCKQLSLWGRQCDCPPVDRTTTRTRRALGGSRLIRGFSSSHRHPTPLSASK